MIFDSHLHVWNPQTAATPWRQGWARHAHGRSFTAEDALSAMRAAGVSRAALVPAAWDVNGNELVLDCASRFPEQFVAFVTPDLRREISSRELSAWRDQGAAGFRVMFPPGVRSWLDDGTADWFWPAAEEVGLPVAVWAPGQVASLTRVARRHRDLRIAVDHLNLGMDAHATSTMAQVDELHELAKLANVAVKASALPCTEADACALLARVVEQFGAERVFWGSDLGRLECSYATAVSVVARSGWTSQQRDRELVLGAGFVAWLSS